MNQLVARTHELVPLIKQFAGDIIGITFWCLLVLYVISMAIKFIYWEIWGYKEEPEDIDGQKS